MTCRYRQVVDEDPVVAAIHANAKEWDPIAEYVYGYLQVCILFCIMAVQARSCSNETHGLSTCMQSLRNGRCEEPLESTGQ